MVKLIRTVSGEYYIGKLIPSKLNSDGYVVLDDARELRIGMTMGGIGVGVTPINPFTIKEDNSISIHNSAIIQMIDEDNIQGELIDKYNQEVSGIKIAKNIPKDASDIII